MEGWQELWAEGPEGDKQAGPASARMTGRAGQEGDGRREE